MPASGTPAEFKLNLKFAASYSLYPQAPSPYLQNSLLRFSLTFDSEGRTRRRPPLSRARELFWNSAFCSVAVSRGRAAICPGVTH